MSFLRSITSISLWFGTTIKVSVASLSFLFLPQRQQLALYLQKANGFVTNCNSQGSRFLRKSCNMKARPPFPFLRPSASRSGTPSDRRRGGERQGGVAGMKITYSIRTTERRHGGGERGEPRVNQQRVKAIVGSVTSRRRSVSDIIQAAKVRRSPGDQPRGDGGRREAEGLHVPRLLHRPVPGGRDGEVLAGDVEREKRTGPVRRVERLLEGDRRGLPRRVPEAGRQRWRPSSRAETTWTSPLSLRVASGADACSSCRTTTTRSA